MRSLARIFMLIALICCGIERADARSGGTGPALDSRESAARSGQATSADRSEQSTFSRVGLLAPSSSRYDRPYVTARPEPFSRRAVVALPSELSEASAKWADLQSRILVEQKTIDNCRAGHDTCPAAAQRFLSIVELGRQSQGRARLGVINRAVNLSIKPVSDWNQYGVRDFWSSPLATLSAGAGDCEDYAIVKYVALREIGIAPDDLRLVIVLDVKYRTNHAVLAVRWDEQWLILDSKTLIMADAEELLHYRPLLVLDQRGARAPAAALGR
jgi:predicted transglutaminase-like cysteine proteinase